MFGAVPIIPFGNGGEIVNLILKIPPPWVLDCFSLPHENNIMVHTNAKIGGIIFFILFFMIVMGFLLLWPYCKEYREFCH